MAIVTGSTGQAGPYQPKQDPAATRNTTTTGTPPPTFGTPEYTDWYYNDPAGPGYIPGREKLVVPGLIKPKEHPGPYQPTPPATEGGLAEGREPPPLTEQQKVTLEDYNKAVDDLKPYEVSPGQYDIQLFLLEAKSPGVALTTLRNAGFSKEDISAAAHANLAEAEEMRKEANRPLYSKIWRGITPWKEEEGETASLGGVFIMGAELLVPGVYTARHWDEMSAGEKGFSIFLDALILAPVGGAIGRGARGVTVPGRLARVGGAVRGAGKEVLYTIRAPVDMILHPVATARGGVRTIADFIENVAHPKKLPEAVITNVNHTVKFRVTDATTPKQAMAIRDKLMEMAARGERPIVKIGDQVVELSRSPLMEELGGGLAHATPNIEVLERARIRPKPGMAAKEQGLFFAHEAPTRFTGGSAFGITAEKGKPGILVISPESAARTISSGKIYRSPRGPVTEMERVLPVGQRVPDIKQRLFTRIGPNKQKVEIWLEKPLTPSQIASLKGRALVEDLKAPFNPAITMKGTGGVQALTENDTIDIITILKRSGNVDQARALTRLSAQGRSVPRTIDDIVRGRYTGTTVTGERVPRTRSRDETIRDVERDIRRRAEQERTARRAEERRTQPREEAARGRERTRAEREAERPAREREREERERERPPREPRREGREREEREPEVERPPRRPTRERGEARVPVRRPPRKEDDEKKARPPLPGAEEKRRQPVFPEGSVAWKQGIGWWVFTPPYTRPEDRVFVLKKPRGAKITADAKTAAGTIQSMGGPSALDLKFDMGIMDVELGKPPARPSRSAGKKEIRFKRDTEGTYGGSRTSARSTKVGPYYYKGGRLSRKKL